jgi:hypothetical protein
VGEVPGQEVVVKGVKGGKQAPSRQKYKKRHRTENEQCTFWFKNHRKHRFLLKSTYKMYSQGVFEEYSNLKFF